MVVITGPPIVVESGIAKMKYDPRNICEAADSAPGVWGHKCILKKAHGRKVAHMCGCGHTWSEPRDPDT